MVVFQRNAASFKSIGKRRSSRHVCSLGSGADRNPESNDLWAGEKRQSKSPGDFSPVSHIKRVIAHRLRRAREVVSRKAVQNTNGVLLCKRVVVTDAANHIVIINI